MVNTEIRLIIFFAAKDGEALYSQQKQDQELTVAQIMSSLLPNSDLNWRKVGKTTRPFMCDLNQIPYDCTNLVTWFITLPSYICFEILSPLPEANLLTPVLLWEGASHSQFRMENSLGTMGSSWVWAEPSEASPPRSSQSLWSTWRVSLMSGWFIPPSQNSGPICSVQFPFDV